MTDLSDAAEILKQAKADQEAESKKAVRVMSAESSAEPAVYTLKADSGVVVRMMDDEPEGIRITEMLLNQQKQKRKS
jgi:hypothetical protein